VSRIAGGAFYNGTVRLYSGTVSNDAVTDTLSGGLGEDWFLSSIGDTLLDKSVTETETRV
jgi:hypothetical protein